jgi:hypothetical protein
MELLLAIQQCSTLLHKEAESEPDSWIREVIAHAAASLTKMEHVNICVSSFSAQGDQLSQWRGYCPQEGGTALESRADI